MDDHTRRLIDRYDLIEEVADFVRRSVGELAGSKQAFRFSGSPRWCGCQDPHTPHVTDTYDTVRYGLLQKYCLGRSGEGLEVVIERRSAGSAETPGHAAGYWIAAESDEV